MRITGFSLLAAAIWAGAAAGAPLAGSQAKAMLFPAEGVEALAYPQAWISESDLKLLGKVAVTQKYYGAIAAAPDEGVMAEPTVVAANYHDVGAARAAALADCNAKRKPAGPACVIVMELRPKGWQARDFSLNADATAAFAGRYLKAGSPKALAVSPSTASWGIGEGGEAVPGAIAACAKEKGAADCAVVVAD